MFSLVNANRPAARKTSSPSRTSGRRVSPNVRSPLSTAGISLRRQGSRPPSRSASRGSLRGRGVRIAQEQRTLGGGEFAELHALDNLSVAVVLCADLDRAPREAPAIGGDPHGHRAV